MIEDTFLKLKSNLELTDTFQQTISRQYNAVSTVIANNHADVKKVRLIGSVGRQTRIQPRQGDPFDIDMLVVLGSFDRWVFDGTGISTSKAMDSVQAAVSTAERYAKKNPEKDSPTVTFDYENNVSIELVPAYLDNIGRSSTDAEHTPKGRAYWVPSHAGWQLADYEFEAEVISKTNALCKGMLIPIVKMLKAAKREHFPTMKSYHLEVIAMNLIPQLITEYEGRKVTITYPLLVGAFLYRLRDQLGRLWNIPGSLSPAFEFSALANAEFVGKADWLRGQIEAAFKAGTDAEKHRLWKTIFNDWIPLS